MNGTKAMMVASTLLAATTAWGVTASTTTTTIRPATTTTLPADADHDGVPNAVDKCPGTAPGDVVDRDGCSVAQLCPCTAPRDASKWRSHGQYVSCVRKALRGFKKAKRLPAKDAGAALKTMRKTQCGAKVLAEKIGKIRCCVSHKKVSSKPFCIQATARSCAKKHGKGMGAGSCAPSPCQ